MIVACLVIHIPSIYIYISIYKEFCVGGSKQKQCFMCHIELLVPNNSILSSYRTATKFIDDFVIIDSHCKLFTLFMLLYAPLTVL